MTLLVAYVIALACPAYAQTASTTASVYKVTDVEVDVTDTSASKARDQAIAQAQRSALDQLLERFGVDSSAAAKLSNDDLSTLVQNFEVRNERSSAVRYIGTFAVQFRPMAVKNFLASRHASYSDAQGNPVLVLPVTKTPDNKVILWEDQTRWSKLWSDAAKDGGLVPIIVPMGNAADKALLTTPDLIADKVDPIKSMINSYHTDGAVIATLNGSFDNPTAGFTIDLQHYGSGFDDASELEHMAVAGTADKYVLDSTLLQSIKQIRKKIEKDQKEEIQHGLGSYTPASSSTTVTTTTTTTTTVDPADVGVSVWSDLPSPSRISVNVEFNTLAEWANIQRRLLASEGVKRVDIVSVGRGGTEIELGFVGKPEDIQLAVAQRGLRLTQDVLSGQWLLKGF